MLRLFTVIVISATLLGCGGGGGSGDSSVDTPTPNPNPSPPPPSTSDEKWQKNAPNYTGLLTPFSTTSQNVSETVYSTIESLDLLISLAFSDDYSYFYFQTENLTNALSDAAVCQSGTLTEEVVETNRRIAFTYQSCQVDDVVVNGTLRVRLDSASTITVLPDLTLTDNETNEALTLTGFYTYQDRGLDATASFNLMVQSELGEQIWYEDVTLQTSHAGADFGIDFSGNIYVSDQGKLTVETLDLGPHTSNNNVDFASSTLQITGTDTIEVNVELQNKMVFSYQPELTPVSIPLDGSVEVDFSAANRLPVAETESDEFSTARNQSFAISALTSFDPDFDPLSVTWQILDTPTDATVELEQGNVTSFTADLPGTYTLRLTVRDPFGGQASHDFAVKVLKGAPSGHITSAPQHVVGSPVHATVSLNNDASDGPFDYRIAYGPANMSVDEEGSVSWDGVIPDYGVNTEVKFAVAVNNGDANVTFEHVLTMTSVDQPLVRQRSTQVTINDLKQGKSGSAYRMSEAISKLEVNDGILSEVPVHMIGLEGDASIGYQATSDVNNDGTDDFWFVHHDADDNTSIRWLDGASKQVNLFTEVDQPGQLFMLDVDMNGSPELVFIGSGTTIFNVQEGDIMLQTELYLDSRYHYCDANDDGFLDVIIESPRISARIGEGYDIVTGESLPTVEAGASFVPTTDQRCAYVTDDNAELMLNWFDSGEQQLLAELPEFVHLKYYIFADIDGDNHQEFLVTFNKIHADPPENLNYTHVFDDIGSENYSSRQLDFLISPGEVVMDVDNDGIDEFLQSTDNGSSGTVTVGYKLTDEAMTEAFRSRPYFNEAFYLVKWDDDDTLRLLQKRRYVEFPLDEAPLFLTTPKYTDVRIVQNQPEFYVSEHSSEFVMRRDAEENVIWSTNVKGDDPFGVDAIDARSSKLVFVEHYATDSILHPDTGEILVSYPHQVGFAGASYAFNDGLDGITRFASMRGRILFSVDDDYTFTQLTAPDLQSAMDDSSSYTFAQIDDDLQPELIVYSVFSQSYRVFDTVTLVEQPPGNFHNGAPEFSGNLSDGSLKQCFAWDRECRNYIVRQKDGSGFNVVDKLTGNIIWSSPNLGWDSNTPYFDRQGSSIRTYLSNRAITIE